MYDVWPERSHLGHESSHVNQVLRRFDNFPQRSGNSLALFAMTQTIEVAADLEAVGRPGPLSRPKFAAREKYPATLTGQRVTKRVIVRQREARRIHHHAGDRRGPRRRPGENRAVLRRYIGGQSSHRVDAGWWDPV